MLTHEEVRARLETSGRWKPGMTLEPIEWHSAQAPPGSLDNLAAYRLIDPKFRPSRDQEGRNWIPVLVVDGDVLVDTSTAMLDRMLASAGYFDRPEAFGDLLLRQFHRLALDFHQGYQVREDSIVFQEGQLAIRGTAYLGAGYGMTEVPFTTRAGRDQPARFEPEESTSLFA